MLGEKIAQLRKAKGISQEELGDILSTSRQAISKWERGEADPDISRLKDLAVYFNVSIDYLLGYDVESTSANNFIEKLKNSCDNGDYSISLDEIKMVVSRNSNNLNLILAAVIYLSDYYYYSHQDEVLNQLIQYLKKAIVLYQPNNIFNTDLNSLHYGIASIYGMQGKYELAKQYLKDNQVIKAEELLSQCELSLGNYEEVEKIVSEIFLSSCGTLINSNAIQIRAFLRTNRVKDALDLADWSIGFVRSISKDEDIMLNVIYMFTFMKACCEKVLALDYSNSINFLKEKRDKTTGFKSVNDGLKFYNNKHIILGSETGDIKSDILKEINEYKKDKVSGYQHAFDIFKEIYGE